MERLNRKPVNSDLYDRICAAQMSTSERETALNALRNADTIVDGAVWLVDGVKRVIARILEKPASLKHSH